MNPFLWLVDTIITLYIWILIGSAVLSWLVVFNVVNTRNPIVNSVGDFLYRVTEPALRADPQHHAQSGRHRHFAGDPDHRPAVSQAAHFLALYPGLRLTLYVRVSLDACGRRRERRCAADAKGRP